MLFGIKLWKLNLIMKQKLIDHICKTSLCKQYLINEKLIIANKKGKKYQLENDVSREVNIFDIDDCVFKNHKIQNFQLCDHIVVIFNNDSTLKKNEKIYIWVELKGSDLDTACGQILNTYNNAITFNKEIKHYARVILKRTNVNDIKKTNYKRIKKLFKENFDSSNILYKEKITKLI